MAFVAYYSLHDTFAGNSFIWVGLGWYKKVLASPEFHAAMIRSLAFSMIVLLIEVPLGIYIALRMPPAGFVSSLYIVLLAIPLLAPSIMVGYLWKALTVVQAKPINGIMTRAGSVLAADIPLLAAASVPGLIPGILLIAFMKKHLARGFSMGRVV